MKIRTFVRLGCIASAIILTGCQATTGQTSLYEKYKFQPDNKALSNAAYMLSGNRYHITKIISNDDESISVIADIYRCSQRTLSKAD